MQSLPDLVHQSAVHPLLFVLSAILLGALHGLEPGHSKTMMAAFIIAIGGTVTQAIVLGLSAMISHTAVVWVVALGGQYLGRGLNAGAVEPYFQLGSAALVACIALWMIGRTRREQRRERSFDGHHDHHDHGDHSLGAFPESTGAVPEHHGSVAHVSLSHGRHKHDHALPFSEGPGHSHAHEHKHGGGLIEDGAYRDAHELVHADQIRRRFHDRKVTTPQIIAFGLTGGLVPCPAAITVLLLCLQLKRMILGVILVGFFSIGLAFTMVMAGVIASLGVHQVKKRWSGFDGFARRAPYASAALMLAIAVYMAISGWYGLSGSHGTL